MKGVIFFFMIIMLFPLYLYSLGDVQFFKAPVLRGGNIVSSGSSGSVIIQYKKNSLEGVIGFFKRELKDGDDINWKKLKDANGVIINDWGNRDWHQIEIVDRGRGEGITVSVRGDSWTWIVWTLVIRFIGVFVVLLVLMISLYVSGGVISWTLAKTGSAES